LLSGAATICRGRANALALDTAPLTFLVPDPSWNDALDRDGPLAYSDPSAPGRLRGSKMTPAGLDLAYTIEDELDGTPPPHPDHVQVGAKVVDADSIVDAPMDCRRWTTRLSRRCWRALLALPAGACARTWPVHINAQARMLHVDFTSARSASCKLLLGVVAATSDDVHAMLFDLSPPDEQNVNERQ
jgi:hypothetical protein